MKFKALGISFNISVPFAVIIAFLLITDKTGLMTVSLVAVFLHELGHFIAMKIQGCAPLSVDFCSAGVLISGTRYCTIKENAVIAFSGPLSNFIFTLLFYCMWLITDVYCFLVFAAVQFILGFVNLFPVKGLDGGTLFICFLKLFPKVNVKLVFGFVSNFTACVITILGAAIAVKNVSNPSLLLLGIYLIILNIMKS